MAKQSYERIANKMYADNLRHVTGVIGHHGATNEEELNECGLSLFGSKWRGVFARDEKEWRNRSGKPYRIVNLDSRSGGMGGTHWTGVADDLVYCSFGEGGKLTTGGNFRHVDDDIEQTYSEENCGQRCLAWLMVYEKNPFLAKLV